MEPDDELAAAIAGRAHWQSAGRSALYTPPGAAAGVRVQPMAQPTRRERYAAVIVRDGRAEHSRPCHTAIEAIRWAEHVRLD